MPGPYRSVTTKKQAARPGSLSQSLFFDHHIRGLVQIAAWVRQNAKKGDLVVCMSCGDLYKAADMMVEK